MGIAEVSVSRLGLRIVVQDLRGRRIDQLLLLGLSGLIGVVAVSPVVGHGLAGLRHGCLLIEFVMRLCKVVWTLDGFRVHVKLGV